MKSLFQIFLFLMIVLTSCTDAADSKPATTLKKTTAEVASAPPAAPPTSEAKQKTPDKTLLLFMNPNGRPCQMQDQILQSMNLKDQVQIRYIKTTNPNDRQEFYNYGIRGLPSLILLDKSGQELHRFPAGIQSPEQIQAVLQ